MSRRSDIDIAEDLYWQDSLQDTEDALSPALEASYDLGRAAQAAQLSRRQWDAATLSNWAKRLRARVRRMVEGR